MYAIICIICRFAKTMQTTGAYWCLNAKRQIAWQVHMQLVQAVMSYQESARPCSDAQNAQSTAACFVQFNRHVAPFKGLARLRWEGSAQVTRSMANQGMA